MFLEFLENQFSQYQLEYCKEYMCEPYNITFILYDSAHPMEKAFELRIGWSLVIDKFHFHSFHGGYCEYRFRYSSTQPTKQSFASR